MFLYEVYVFNLDLIERKKLYEKSGNSEEGK